MGETGQAGRGFQPKEFISELATCYRGFKALVQCKKEDRSSFKSMTPKGKDSDVHITLDDQQKINHFARCYAKRGDVLAELKTKQCELKNLEDAAEELVLFDEENASIPFLQGEVFMCLDLNDTNKALEREKRKVLDDIKELEEASEELKTVLSNLKTQLYAKFGSHINLED